MSLEQLTLLSTTFIVLSGLSLLVGWYFIRFRKNQILHRNFMLGATVFAALFLVAYLTRTFQYGSKPFGGTGGWKLLYLATLFPHIVLAMVVGPLALWLLYLALRKRDFATHRRVGRVTVPIWIYVAASGWLIYFMLYKMF